MRAYKVLNNGRSDFSGRHWPLPDHGQPGEWVLADGELRLCRNGIHASTVQQLPHWLGMELWEIELDGEIQHEESSLIASQGRLVAKVEAWDEPMRKRFASWCLERARDIAENYPPGEGLANKVQHTLWWGGTCGLLHRNARGRVRGRVPFGRGLRRSLPSRTASPIGVADPRA